MSVSHFVTSIAAQMEIANKLLAKEQSEKLLKAQLAATTERQKFLEDCIAEMAAKIYK